MVLPPLFQGYLHTDILVKVSKSYLEISDPHISLQNVASRCFSITWIVLGSGKQNFTKSLLLTIVHGDKKKTGNFEKPNKH